MEGHRAVSIQCHKGVTSLIEKAVSAVKVRAITDANLMEGSRKLRIGINILTLPLCTHDNTILK